VSITVTEKFDSRTSAAGESPSVELKYLIVGTGDDVAAKEALADAAPVSYDGLVRKTWDVAPVGDGSGFWEGTVRYGRYDNSPPEVGESSYSFDTGGGTQHITQALDHIASYAPSGETAPDHDGAIGVTHDSVEGVDITVPVYRFSETHIIDDDDVTLQYKANLFILTGRVNQSAFKGFAAGEVLFLGASGSKRGDDDWEITFNYAASPNVTNLPVGSITVASKKGWEYLWVEYGDAADDDAKSVVKRPRAAHVEKVYRDGDFSSLP